MLFRSRVRQTDRAGNVSAAASLTFTLDSAVAAPTVALTRDTGANTTDRLTNVGTLAVTGLESGALVEYSTDAGATWSSSFTATPGLNQVLVRQTDVAGNSATAAVFEFTLDTSAASPAVALANDTGASGSDLITRNAQLNVTGLEAGATVQYQLNSSTTWSSSITPVQGLNTVRVRQIDAAGNASAATTLAFTFDTVAAIPRIALASDTGSSTTDKVTSNGNLSVTGAEGGATLQYSGDGGATWTGSFMAAEGANSVLVRQVDVAGNVSAASTALAFRLDTVAAAPIVALANDTGVDNTDKIKIGRAHV